MTSKRISPTKEHRRALFISDYCINGICWNAVCKHRLRVRTGQYGTRTGALNNTQHEMTTCAAFSSIMTQCTMNRRRPEEEAQYQELVAARDQALKDATSLGLEIGMTPDALSSRFGIEVKTMQDLIKKDCVNVSSLLSRFAMRCKQVFDNPASILEEYMRPLRRRGTYPKPSPI